MRLPGGAYFAASGSVESLRRHRRTHAENRGTARDAGVRDGSQIIHGSSWIRISRRGRLGRPAE